MTSTTYKPGHRYSPDDLGVAAVQHRGHGLAAYLGRDGSWHEFQCEGCGDIIWVGAVAAPAIPQRMYSR